MIKKPKIIGTLLIPVLLILFSTTVVSDDKLPTMLNVEENVAWLEEQIKPKFSASPAVLFMEEMIFPSDAINETHIEDRYGIFDMPHQYAVKFVKFQGVSKGRLETYKKIGNEYVMQHSYSVDYPREGPKNKPWDMRTVGGNVVRYLYRTTRSGMNGYNKEREHFGVYKVSFPMPHDVEPLIEAGKLPKSYLDKIPVINYRGPEGRQMLYPHPASAVGADIVIHTARKGTRGCIIIENEAMSSLYHEDLVTENDQEIIPFVIYDESVEAPPIGQLL